MKNPIQTIRRCSGRADVLRFLIQKFPKDKKKFHLQGRFGNSTAVLGLVGITELCSLLSQLENLKLRIGFKNEALAYPLNQLSTNYSIKYLELSLNYEHIVQNQQILNCLVAFTHCNVIIEHI